jgi:hypothetical protein
VRPVIKRKRIEKLDELRLLFAHRVIFASHFHEPARRVILDHRNENAGLVFFIDEGIGTDHFEEITLEFAHTDCFRHRGEVSLRDGRQLHLLPPKVHNVELAGRHSRQGNDGNIQVET